MKTEITNRQQLHSRLQELKDRKRFLESSIIENSSRTYEVLTDPAPIIRRTLHELAGDGQVRNDVFHIILNSAANFLGRKFAGSSFISGLMEKFTSKQQSSHSSDTSSNEDTSDEHPHSKNKNDLFTDILQMIVERRKEAKK